MRGIICFLLSCTLAAAVPLWTPSPPPPASEAFPGWPVVFEGMPLRQLPISANEKLYERGFPGRIGRFTDGRREVIIRWVTRETRMLHSATDCLRGLGYAVKPGPLYRDASGHCWSTFTARKGSERLHVRELIADPAGRTWSDPSDWYWAATLQRIAGPWWAYTVAERVMPTE
ncbi:MAG: hypothetical protein ACYC6A_02680 [Armatimonadota bacterium]